MGKKRKKHNSLVKIPFDFRQDIFYEKITKKSKKHNIAIHFSDDLQLEFSNSTTELFREHFNFDKYPNVNQQKSDFKKIKKQAQFLLKTLELTHDGSKNKLVNLFFNTYSFSVEDNLQNLIDNCQMSLLRSGKQQKSDLKKIEKRTNFLLEALKQTDDEIKNKLSGSLFYTYTLEDDIQTLISSCRIASLEIDKCLEELGRLPADTPPVVMGAPKKRAHINFIKKLMSIFKKGTGKKEAPAYYNEHHDNIEENKFKGAFFHFVSICTKEINKIIRRDRGEPDLFIFPESNYGLFELIKKARKLIKSHQKEG